MHTCSQARDGRTGIALVFVGKGCESLLSDDKPSQADGMRYIIKFLWGKFRKLNLRKARAICNIPTLLSAFPRPDRQVQWGGGQGSFRVGEGEKKRVCGKATTSWFAMGNTPSRRCTAHILKSSFHQLLHNIFYWFTFSFHHCKQYFLLLPWGPSLDNLFEDRFWAI
jgi:hypothetical protein